MPPQTPKNEPQLSLSLEDASESLVGTQSRTATFRPDEPAGGRIEVPPPEIVGRYQIRRLLGRGAFGAVYLGFDPQLKRQVAIKVPRLAAENSAEQIESFLEEARRAVQLERHQGIVPVYDVGRDGDLCYIVSQYIEGGTLTQLLRNGPLPAERAVRLAATLADVVHFAHRQGWVHRDIKPSNILLDAEGNPYLADFGLTSRLDEMRTADGPPSGTPNYMAPELAREALAQIRRQTAPAALRPDQRSDVYSLGVVLYQLLTGNLPFEADNLSALFDLVLHADPVPPRLAGAKISARLEDVCLKALAKEPGARYLTAADLRDDLNIVAMALSVPEDRIKVDNRGAWGFSPVRLAAVAGTGLLLAGLVLAAWLVANNFWRRPVEHTSPGGETNVAMLDPKGMGGANGESPSPPGGVPQNRALDRAVVLQELRDLLLEDQPDGTPRGFGGAMRKGTRKFQANPAPGGTPDPPRIASLAPPAGADAPFPNEFAALQKNIEAARDKKDLDGEYALLMKATNELVDGGHAREAEQAAERMVEISGPDASKRPFAYGQLGLAQSALGKYDEAVVSQEKALATYRELHNLMKGSSNPKVKGELSHISRLVGITLNRIGNAHKQMQKYDEADKAFTEAKEVLSPHEDRKAELTTVLMNQGSLYSVRLEHDEAQKVLGEALRLAEQQRDEVAQAEVLVNLGNAQARAGHDAKAIESYALADKLLPETASYDARSRLLYNWITSLLSVDRYDEARLQIARLREIARPDDPFAQRILKIAAPLLEDALPSAAK